MLQRIRKKHEDGWSASRHEGGSAAAATCCDQPLDVSQNGQNARMISVRQRVGPHLNFVKLRSGRRSAFIVEYRTRACRGPQSFALPAGVRIVDAAVHVLAEEAHGVRDMNVYKFAVHERQQSLVAVGFRDWHVCAETERVKAIHPEEIGVICAAWISNAFELRPRKLIQRPTFGALLAGGRGRPIQRTLALAAGETGKMAGRNCRPNDTVRIKGDPARPQPAVPMLVYLLQH